MTTPMGKAFVRGSTGERWVERRRTTDREKEIVRLVAQGYGDDEIGKRLFLSEEIVKDQLHGIFEKFGVSNRFELMLHAIQHHLIDPSYRQLPAEKGPGFPLRCWTRSAWARLTRRLRNE
jgi:DNA-binding CsgD family transcriptional regulator